MYPGTIGSVIKSVHPGPEVSGGVQGARKSVCSQNNAFACLYWAYKKQ
jgi:hypothetical protein